MPVAHQYTVTETREVRVMASSMVDALRIAQAVMNQTQPPEGVWGRVIRPTQVIAANVKRDS